MDWASFFLALLLIEWDIDLPPVDDALVEAGMALGLARIKKGFL